MGSFNVACGISSASIGYGERVGMLPIIPQKFKHVSKWFFGDCDKYIPVSPAIYGIYNDYGSITDVERSPVVDYLEKIYDMPVELLIKCMQAETPTDYDVVREFYSVDSVLLREPYEPNIHKCFENLGFTRIEPESAVDIWQLEEFFVVAEERGDNESSYIKSFNVSSENSKGIEYRTIHAADVSRFVVEFHKATGRWAGMSKINSDRFNKVSEVVWMPFLPEVFENIVENGNLLNVSDRWFADLVEDLPGAFERCANTRSGAVLPVDFSLRNHARDFVSIDDEGYRSILEFPDEWKRVFQFSDVMRAANKAYLPIISGDQVGNPYVEKIVAETLLKRYEKFREEYGE